MLLSSADSVLSVAWSPLHPDLVASGGQDDKAFIWRVSGTGVKCDNHAVEGSSSRCTS